jgi:hypothetical protein
MTWTLWAALLLTHGAFSRWAQSTRHYAVASIFGDGLLIAIGLVTLERLQGLEPLEIARIGLFFTAFGASGRQLMHGILKQYPFAALGRQRR